MQASLGEVKDKGNEGVPVFVKFDNKKLVIGTLSADKCAQIQYDLVFEKEFELSHGSKNTSIYFLGYKTVIQEEGEYPFDICIRFFVNKSICYYLFFLIIILKFDFLDLAFFFCLHVVWWNG